MFEAMRQAAFLHKLVSKDPRVVSARTALEMATIGGARVIGREKELGSLEAGKLADLIIVRMDQAAPDADVRSGVSPCLRHPRRRCRHDHRERSSVDARREGPDAQRAAGAGRGSQGVEQVRAAVERDWPRSDIA